MRLLAELPSLLVTVYLGLVVTSNAFPVVVLDLVLVMDNPILECEHLLNFSLFNKKQLRILKNFE